MRAKYSVDRDFTQLKSSIEKIVKERFITLTNMFLSGNGKSVEDWKKLYLRHPVLKLIAQSLVWKQGRSQFILTTEELTNYEGDSYDLSQDYISLVHPIEMSSEEITKWQSFLASHSIKQFFPQIWEPVFITKEYDPKDRFKQLMLTGDERKLLKSNLEKKGINMYTDEYQSSFDGRKGAFVFSDYNTMHFGDIASGKYKINNDKSIIFENIIFADANNRRSMNAVAAELEKLNMRKTIMADDYNSMIEGLLDRFTLFQIEEFINIANENNSINCKTKLLDYRNNKYPHYESIDDLVL